MGMFKKNTAKNVALTSINGITATNVADAIAQISEQLGSISTGTGSTGGTTVVSTTYDSGNFTVAYTLNSSQKIIQEVYTGDINRTRIMEYVPNGQSGAGKIKKEIITENGKAITIIYSYDAYGNISGKNTTTVAV